ncbi:Transmembrane_domain-containing protein [Hexamita inflata]|uniref:Transmembrane domain-containing protein n=1 Tax=Hexamita inflata TaxID=28002 RepID=A0AA86QZ95_9EUKA|nr:Transmembrane domain-containing protein [Hexamita inflata]
MKFLPVPDATKKQLYACGSLNMIVPGSGLLLLSARTFEMRGVFVACLQFVTWFFVFGWVWAVVNGCKMIIKGRTQE